MHQRTLALTSLGVSVPEVVSLQAPAGLLPLSIPPRNPVRNVFSVVAQIGSRLEFVEAGTSLRAKGIGEGRTTEASEAKMGDLRPWARLSISKQLR